MAQNKRKLETEIQKLPIAQLRHLEKNARYMTSEQQQRLTDNVKDDGGLTSLPLVWLMQGPRGKPTQDPPVYEIVSGNHRVTSARNAELVEIDCIVITNWISAERRVEIQLAHNAVSGQDDLSLLEELYEGLDLTGKEYSGLTDDVFSSLKDLSLTGFNVDGPDYQEIVLSFLPDDAEQFEALIVRASKSEKALFHTGSLEHYDTFFDTIVRTKETQNIQNNAMAIVALAELAMERMDQLEQEQDDQDVVEEPS